MKRVLCVLCLATVLGGCSGPDFDDPKSLDRILAEAVDEDELQERSDEGAEHIPGRSTLYYLTNKQTPYSGWVKKMYSSGQVSDLMEIKEGKRDGVAMKWYRDGQKQAQAGFKDGKPHGKILHWHKNGQKLGEGSFKNGKEHGLWKEYNGHGQLRKK